MCSSSAVWAGPQGLCTWGPREAVHPLMGAVHPSYGSSGLFSSWGLCSLSLTHPGSSGHCLDTCLIIYIIYLPSTSK